MIAFDSNVLIYFLEKDPVFWKKAEDIFLKIESSGGICSSLAITEVMYGTINSVDKITPLLSLRVSVVPVSASIASLAGKIKMAQGLKNIDAIHIATALASGAKDFVTNDQELLKKSFPGLKIHGL